MSPLWLIFALKLINSVLDPRCLKVHIFTDIAYKQSEGNKKTLNEHPEIAPLLKMFEQTRIQGPLVVMYA
jgi:hypothetical protein